MKRMVLVPEDIRWLGGLLRWRRSGSILLCHAPCVLGDRSWRRGWLVGWDAVERWQLVGLDQQASRNGWCWFRRACEFRLRWLGGLIRWRRSGSILLCRAPCVLGIAVGDEVGWWAGTLWNGGSWLGLARIDGGGVVS
jgi:hypothetical protein